MNPNVEHAAMKTVLAPETYEAPRVEVVLDADSLQREVHYAGIPSAPA